MILFLCVLDTRMYGIKSADAIYVKSKTHIASGRSNTKAMEILGISANWILRSDSLRTETTDMSACSDDGIVDFEQLDFENQNEVICMTDDEQEEEMDTNDNDIVILLEDEDLDEIINQEEKKDRPMCLSPIQSININNSHKKHKMHRSASYDLGAIDNELRRFNDINSPNSGKKHSNHNSVRSLTDLFKNAKFKQLHEIHEETDNNIQNKKLENENNQPDSDMNDMVNLLYLMVKQGLYTSKNFNSVQQISRYNNNNSIGDLF